MKKLRMILGLSTVVLALALAPAAGAKSSSVDTYGGNASAVAGIASGNDPGDSSGSLPFTGLDVSLLIGGGALLLGLGVGMAKLTSRRSAQGA